MYNEIAHPGADELRGRSGPRPAATLFPRVAVVCHGARALPPRAGAQTGLGRRYESHHRSKGVSSLATTCRAWSATAPAIVPPPRAASATCVAGGVVGLIGPRTHHLFCLLYIDFAKNISYNNKFPHKK